LMAASQLSPACKQGRDRRSSERAPLVFRVHWSPQRGFCSGRMSECSDILWKCYQALLRV